MEVREQTELCRLQVGATLGPCGEGDRARRALLAKMQPEPRRQSCERADGAGEKFCSGQPTMASHQRSSSTAAATRECAEHQVGCATRAQGARHAPISSRPGGATTTRASARRELFAGQNEAELRANKWWRSCWNGNQLDGHLLYETVKAQQERRLARQVGRQSSLETAQADDCESVEEEGESGEQFESRSQVSERVEGRKGGEMANSQALYAVPRARQKRHTCPLAASVDHDDHDDDPLRDPLYASVLGTSKQLSAIANAGNRHRQPGAAGDDELESNRRIRTLVERCLEVQRATTTSGGRLLLIKAEGARGGELAGACEASPSASHERDKAAEGRAGLNEAGEGRARDLQFGAERAVDERRRHWRRAAASKSEEFDGQNNGVERKAGDCCAAPERVGERLAVEATAVAATTSGHHHKV